MTSEQVLNKALEITKKYKQHKQFNDYVVGFKDLYKDVFERLPKSKTSLDIGAAYGILALMLKIRGDKTDACDMTEKYSNLKMFKDNKIDFFKHNIEKENFLKTYDLITMTEVIEHWNSNPLPAMKAIYQALNKGGHLVMTTAAREIHGYTTSMNTGKAGLWNDLITWRDIPVYKGKWMDEHTYHYTQFDLVSLVNEVGFKVEDCYILNNFTLFLIAKKV